MCICLHVKKEAGRDQCRVCLGLCVHCCTIISHQFSSVNRLAWSQRYGQQSVPGWGVEPGSLSYARSLSVYTNVHKLKRNVSHFHSVPLPLCPFLLYLGSCSKCLAFGTFTSPKLNHSPSCTFPAHFLDLCSQLHNKCELIVCFLGASLSFNTALNKICYLICNVEWC